MKSKLKIKIPETLPGLPKKRIIKFLPNSALVAIPVLGTAGVWYAHKQGYIHNSFLDSLLGPGPAQTPAPGTPGAPIVTQPAANITLSAYPPVVRPDSTVVITGEFLGPGNTPITVAQGFYAIYEELQDISTGLRRQVDAGSLGTNLSVYNKTIPTNNWRDGTYTIIVSDQPIMQDPGDATALFNTGATGQAGYNSPPVPQTATGYNDNGNDFGITLS